MGKILSVSLHYLAQGERRGGCSVPSPCVGTADDTSLFRRSLKELKEEEEQEEQGVNFQAGLALFLADNPLPRSLNRQDGDSGGADPGCLSRIPDPNFFHPGSELFSSRIPDPHQNLSFLNQKIVSKLSEI